ncbi:MAG: septal ring lytic transglycosylase RlpA family protein [Firmicutes bacterium]|jgi:hypothetical protein|nr:septal ring lytic transglycosylase RlpA family protein [Bacillota bacterium]
MFGLGFSGLKRGKAGFFLLALAAASSGLAMGRGLGAGERAVLDCGDSCLERSDVALGRMEQRQELFLVAPPQPPRERAAALPARGERPAGVQQGLASWYGGEDGLHGARTASGERFDPNAFTAAHPTLPFGTKVRVTFLKTGRSVEVRINDRGPFVPGRIIDLSRAAAEKIGLLPYGVGTVRLEVLP